MRRVKLWVASQLRGIGGGELQDELLQDITIYLDMFHLMLPS
jgi:hypothetical protein